jgi:hypothetical protein
MGFKKGAYGSAKGVRAKAANLSDAQLKRAGALKASKKAPIDYTKTSRVLGSGVTRGPGGKLLTGKVTLANGKTAVYKAGKRVVNKPVSNDKPKPPPAKTPPLNMRRNAPGYGIPQKPKTGVRGAISGTVAAALASSKPSVSSQAKATAGGSYGGRAGGFGPMGTPTQQRIVQLKNRLADAKAQAVASAAKASKDASARAQAQKDAAAVKTLETQLKAIS